MKKQPVIQSVQSRVRFVESELKRLINRQQWKGWFWKRTVRLATGIPDGYTALSTFSVTVPLSGTVAIGTLDRTGNVVTVQVPSSTHFLVTCIYQPVGSYQPELSVSLS